MKYENEQDVKSWQMKCRFTPADKEKILKYCEEHNMNVSDFVRFAVNEIFKKAKID